MVCSITSEMMFLYHCFSF